MRKLYKFITVLINNHPIIISVGIIIFILLLAIVIMIVLKKRRLKVSENKRKLEELNQKKIEEERIFKKAEEAKLYEMKWAEYEKKEAELKKKKIENDKKKEKIDNEAKSLAIKILKEKERISLLQKEELKSDFKSAVVDKVEEPHTLYQPKNEKPNISTESANSSKIKKNTEQLPEARKEIIKELIEENLFVNYKTTTIESVATYPVFRSPKNGCIVRTHRLGNTKRRGFKEKSFQTSIQMYFGKNYIVLGDVRLNTGKETRPFEPDIAIIDRKKDKNIRIDIEIDEPYAGISRQPTHCSDEDLMRDIYFIDRGWIVIRFSEFQVHTQEKECLNYIAKIIKSIDNDFSIPMVLTSVDTLKIEKKWDIVQAQKWEKAKYRENYLNHVFGEIIEEQETIERDFDEQELNEEKLVKPSIIGEVDNGKRIGINKVNSHPRDARILFYPDSHVYTIDNAPVPSASTIISKFFPEFDSVYWSNRKAPELGMTPENVALMWKTKGEKASNDGTYLHEQIENYYLGEYFNRTEEFHLFEQFLNDHNTLTPHRTEWRIFDEEYNIAGTIDLIAKNGQSFEIYDWKRSKKVVNEFNGEPIKDNRFQCGVGKLQNIPDTSYNRYCLQQSLYRYIIEKRYNLRISKMYLIVLYPEYKRYYKVETPYQKDIIEYILKTL